ncbi:GFA family protein [Wenxinia marina]|uniref:CENP-V/GFA domain-containing protein n=1 Tax=Wenxinia marina DSM 24838 TaxID=1123501 RepID=A0A0D0Q5X2_9RHOB|nr:GFA family protein [Wenxinia marina]KIQ67892.1 hypothetical protein Wenmar_03622 [Wenxinia marina DSM 24838]GGL74291.1 hypothetical protein GCM10011392_31050 [Wenxinia marina]
MDEEGMTLPDGPWEGGCQCGKVRFRAERLHEAGHLCHCRMCQRATGSLFAALVGIARAELVWSGPSATFRSSTNVERRFCPSCGTALSYEGDGDDVVGVSIGAFDRAADVPIDRQSDTYARHPSLSALRWLHEDFAEDYGPNPDSLQDPR